MPLPLLSPLRTAIPPLVLNISQQREGSVVKEEKKGVERRSIGGRLLR